MSDTTSDELRIDLPEGEALPEVDPQADRRAEIAEAYERRREQEIKVQWEQAGLPADEAPEPPRRDAEPEGEATEQAAQPDPRYPPVAPTTPAAPQRPPQAPQQAYQPPPQQQPRQPRLDRERAALLAQRLSFGTTEEQADALQEFAETVSPDVDRIKREAQAEWTAKQKLDADLATIGREYPEIFNDPILTQVAALQLHNLRGYPAVQQNGDRVAA
jgi:hypothetical protein